MSYLKGLPLPEYHIDYEPFWEGCRRKSLLIQKCKDCGWYRHYPRPLCPKCFSWSSQWAEVCGKGKVWSWTVIFHSIDPAAAGKAPYNIVEVELEEQQGLRLTSNIIDCEPEDIYIGMPVEVVFEDAGSNIVLPRFKKVIEV